MAYPRVLTVQDISCVGQCSLTVALPVLSACGVETCILPTAVLSSHTGGFQNVQKKDLTDCMPAFSEQWQKENIRFDYIYSGYLGSSKQVDYVMTILEQLRSSCGIAVVDPAMADHGMLYRGFDSAFVEAMGRLCQKADVLIPNITEACMLTGIAYQEILNQEYVSSLLHGLGEMGCDRIVLTGVGFCPEETGAAIWENGRIHYHFHRRIPQNYHGTGDLFASAMVGAMAQGNLLRDAVRIASEFVARCIEVTHENPAHWYGVKFEPVLSELITMLERKG